MIEGTVRFVNGGFCFDQYKSNIIKLCRGILTFIKNNVTTCIEVFQTLNSKEAKEKTSMMTPETGGNLQRDEGSSAATVKPKRGGLEGVVAATTALSKVEGTAGRLIYRGYNIHDLARTTTFEEVAYLLWFGHLPNQQELAELHARFVAERTIPSAVLQVIQALPVETEPMDALRTATSAWG